MNAKKFIIDSLNESADTKLKIKDQLMEDIIKAVDLLSACYKKGINFYFAATAEAQQIVSTLQLN